LVIGLGTDEGNRFTNGGRNIETFILLLRLLSMSASWGKGYLYNTFMGNTKDILWQHGLGVLLVLFFAFVGWTSSSDFKFPYIGFTAIISAGLLRWWLVSRTSKK